MKKEFKILFLKQDIFRFITFIFIVLSLLSGGSIVYSKEYLAGSFRVDNIHAMFATIFNFLLIFMAVNLFGKEFSNKTINLIRTSGRGSVEVILRKSFAMVILGAVATFFSFVEVAFDQIIYKHSETNLVQLLFRLLLSYSIYSIFLFVLGSLIVFFFKSSLLSFVFLLLFLKIGVTIMNILANFDVTSNLVKYFPLSFAEESFYFSNFTFKQTLVMIVWSLIMLSILPYIYERRGYI
ncbi:hypothetical protein [Lactococcus lactis]|uniref:hypothetical protein n=1 Tax=Lactococcus lactis TaxID=1358 RepID=UPI00071DF9FD|nr:hypothetical protein [Lactococcus lactis]KST94214.1 hypothetical protein KF146_2230 [Lactococcus lactis subsp. lactis]MDU0396637.1 hypothetical protein [Lactococcus lactis]